MLVLYASKTGNVKRFVDKLGIRAFSINEIYNVREPYVLITYTTGFGQVPQEVAEFLNRNSNLLRGVASSGNRNWGSNYGKSADLISRQYGVPILLKFELSGVKGDSDKFKEGMTKLL